MAVSDIGAEPWRSMHCRTFPGQPAQVPVARGFVAQALRACPSANDAALLTSELVTNALCHTATAAGGTFTVTVQHTARAVTVTVADAGAPTIPALAHPDWLTPSGRGLALVDALSARWGHNGNEHGRSVWFEIGCP